MRTQIFTVFGLALASQLLACGGGVPVRLRIDEMSMQLDADSAVSQVTQQLQSSGFLPALLGHLPAEWPPSLPALKYTTDLDTPPLPVDLNPDPNSPEAAKYKKINNVKKAIGRIEINRLVLRVEQSDLSIALPSLTLQVADDPKASPDDRHAWVSIGTLPGAAPGFVGDLELKWIPGGESFLDSQLGDTKKEFAIRAKGQIHLDTSKNRLLPRGKAVLRVIVVATFFVEPQKAL